MAAAPKLAISRHSIVVLLLGSMVGCCSAQLTGSNVTAQTCDIKLDIVFIVDASGSVGVSNFDKTLQFVDNVVKGLVVGPFNTRVGMVMFQSSPILRFHLNTYTNQQDVLKAVTDTVYTGGGTDTAEALQYATDTSFSTVNGMRPNAAQVAVVITDGKSGTRVTADAQRLRDKGVTVFAVGVGTGIDMLELEDIASDPDVDHVFDVDSFDALNLILATLQGGACSSEAAFLCGGRADIVFLLDESGSVGTANFQTMLGFVLDVADAFIIGPSDVLIGLSTFSTQYNQWFPLTDGNSKATLDRLLSTVIYKGGQTNTGDAINALRTSAFTVGQGHRIGVPKIAIVVTDGKSADKAKTAREAQAAKDDGIVLLSIGIGSSTDDAELAAIATDPDSQNVHRASTFDALRGLENYVAAKVCAEIGEPTTGPGPCGPQADLVFVLDTSGSVGPDNFRLVLNFINNFVKDLQIGMNNIRVGVEKFGSRPYKEFDLNRFFNKTDIMDAISNIDYASGGTDTAGAIKYMTSIMFKAASGNRPGIPDVAVVITDGRSNNPRGTAAAAQQAKADGITIFAVGVGNSISVDELNSIASDPDNSHVLTVSEFTKLNAIKTVFKVQACQAIPQNLTNTTSVTPTPAPPVDLCQDLIPNCDAYNKGVCTAFRIWSTVFCPKTCQICSPNFPVVPPPCEDKAPNCAAYGVSVCTGTTQPWAEQNCRKFCGYCGAGSQTDGFFNKCYYKGEEYGQGARWQDGCAYDCECSDARTGQYICYNKCPSYYNLPVQCPLVRQPGQCCLKPVCNFDGNFNSTTDSSGNGVCTYNGQNYNQGQIWSDGCQKQCLCLNAASGFYVCQSLCARYDWLPSDCKLEKRPGECCAKPRCQFDSQVGVISGDGSTSGPGGAAGANGTNSTQPGVCLYNGNVYSQDDTWYDGCDRFCVCDNAKFGFWRCQQRCPDFTNLPANCSMVTVLGQCCKSVYCENGGNFTSSQPDPDVIGSEPPPTPPPRDYPKLPPNETYAPGQDPNPNPPPPPPTAPPSSPLVPPPQLSCPPVREGDTATLTCSADLKACQSSFLLDWSLKSRDLASCATSACGGPYVIRDGVDVTMTVTGSIVTVQNVTRDSPYASSRWGCEFCGGGEVTCEKLEVYAFPDNPRCSMNAEFDPRTGDILGVMVTCSTTRVFPQSKCDFYRMVDQDQPIRIMATPIYHHIPDNQNSVTYFRTYCSVRVPVVQLGEGTHSFIVQVYPDVFDGQSVAKVGRPPQTVQLSLPRAAHSCPSDMLDAYLCGKPSVCNCSLVAQGYPSGRPVWYSRDVIQSQALGGAVVISYDSRNPTIDFTCEAVSALGRNFGSSLKVATESVCN